MPNRLRVNIFLQKSFYLNAQLSFCSGVPLLVTSIASKNSLKSMKPFLSLKQHKLIKNCTKIKTEMKNKSFCFLCTKILSICFPIEGSENMITEVFSTSTRETFAVYFHKGILGEFSIWTVLFETFVPLTDCILDSKKTVKRENMWNVLNKFFSTHNPPQCNVCGTWGILHLL